MAESQPALRVVEQGRRLSESLLWSLQRRYFERAGVAAPQLQIIETGAGTGRFGYYLLRHLDDVPAKLVITDFGGQNMEFLARPSEACAAGEGGPARVRALRYGA